MKPKKAARVLKKSVLVCKWLLLSLTGLLVYAAKTGLRNGCCDQVAGKGQGAETAYGLGKEGSTVSVSENQLAG